MNRIKRSFSLSEQAKFILTKVASGKVSKFVSEAVVYYAEYLSDTAPNKEHDELLDLKRRVSLLEMKK